MCTACDSDDDLNTLPTKVEDPPVQIGAVLDDLDKEHEARQALEKRLRKLYELVRLINTSLYAIRTLVSAQTAEAFYSHPPNLNNKRHSKIHWRLGEISGEVIYLRSDGILVKMVSSAILRERWTKPLVITDLSIDEIDFISGRIEHLVSLAK